MTEQDTCPVCGSEQYNRFVNGVLRCFNCEYRPKYDNSITHRLKHWWRSL